MKREAELKGKFSRALRWGLPHFITLQHTTAGAPDRTLVGNGVTSHWEFKHGTPDYLSPGIQELMCMRLAEQGYCRYVLWMETRRGTDLHTLVVHPRHVHDKSHVADLRFEGHDMAPLIALISRIHSRK